MKHLKSIILFPFIAISTISLSQEKAHNNELSLLAGISWGKINNENISSDKYASVKNHNSVNAGLNYCKYINKVLGISFGVEYSRVKQTVEYKGAFRSETKSTDRDGFIYYPVIETDYKDIRTINFVDIPLALRLEGKLNDYVSIYFEAGVKLNLLFSSKFEEKGNYENKGAYPNVSYSNVFLLIEDDTYYGFSRKVYNSKEDLKANRINYSFAIASGIKTKLNDHMCLLINPVYTGGLNNYMSKNGGGEYKNIFGEKTEYKAFKFSQFAMRIGLVFVL
jgi:hypothetical protein